VTPARRLALLALLGAVVVERAGAQVSLPGGSTIDSLRPCAAAAAVLPGGTQVVRGRIRAEHVPAGRQTVIQSLPDSARHPLRGVRSLTLRTSTWHRGTEAQPSAMLELRVVTSARAGESSRFILLLDGRSLDLGELRERAVVDSAGRELSVWLISAGLTARQFQSLVRASRVGVAAGRIQTTLTAAEREGARAVFVRAVCGG
jgi:hypothetical protein